MSALDCRKGRTNRADSLVPQGRRFGEDPRSSSFLFRLALVLAAIFETTGCVGTPHRTGQAEDFRYSSELARTVRLCRAALPRGYSALEREAARRLFAAPCTEFRHRGIVRLGREESFDDRGLTSFGDRARYVGRYRIDHAVVSTRYSMGTPGPHIRQRLLLRRDNQPDMLFAMECDLAGPPYPVEVGQCAL